MGHPLLRVHIFRRDISTHAATGTEEERKEQHEGEEGEEGKRRIRRMMIRRRREEGLENGRIN